MVIGDRREKRDIADLLRGHAVEHIIAVSAQRLAIGVGARMCCESLKFTLFLLDQRVKATPGHVLRSSEIELGEIVASVRTDEIVIGEEFTCGGVAFGAVADQVDVGPIVEAANQERAGDTDQALGAAFVYSLDDRQHVLARAGTVHQLRIVADVPHRRTRGVVFGNVLDRNASNDTPEDRGVQVALRSVRENAERFRYDTVLTIPAAEEATIAFRVGVILDIAEVVAVGMDVADDFEDQPVTVQEVVPIAD